MSPTNSLNARPNGSPSKYVDAVRYAGRLPDPDPYLLGQNASGMAVGSSYSLHWGEVPSPRLALSAANVAAYAEIGSLEDGVEPTDYIEGLVMSVSPNAPLENALDQHPLLKVLCEDALRRGLADQSLTNTARGKARLYLDALCPYQGAPHR